MRMGSSFQKDLPFFFCFVFFGVPAGAAGLVASA